MASAEGAGDFRSFTSQNETREEMNMTSWSDLLKEAMEANGDTFPPLFCTLSDKQLRVEFDGSFGCVEGKPFTAWGEKWVYFPLNYDGAESVGCAPRDPCDISMEHQS